MMSDTLDAATPTADATSPVPEKPGTALAVVPPPKAATPTPPQLAPKVASPFYLRYLNDQAAAIRANGGDDSAVNQFLDIEQRKPFSRGVPGAASAAPTLQEMLGADASPSAIRGVSMAVLQGATFGFGDEAVGALLGHLTGVGARAGIDEYRREYADWSEQHSKTALAAEIAGGFLPAALTGGASVEGALARPTVGKALATGAVYGAAYGAGNANGAMVSDLSATLKDEVSDRLWGAVTGAAGGAALGATAHALGTFVVAPTAARLASTSVGEPIAAAVENVVNKIAGKDVVALTPEAQARQRLAATLLSEGVDFNELKGRLADMHREGVPGTVIDAGGDATQALAASVLKNRSPATAAVIDGLNARQGAQAGRLGAGLLDVAMQRLRFGISNATETAERLQEQALIDSKPLYDTAHEQVVQLTPALRQLFAAPEIQAGWDAGASMARGEDLAGIGHGLPVSPLPRDPKTGQLLLRADQAAELPVRGIDYLQRGLQEVINKGRNAEGWSAQRIRVIQSLRDQVVAEAESQVPSFAAARAAYRGPTASAEAINTGKSMFGMAPAELKSAMNDLHPADRDYARLGYVQKVYDATLRDNTGDVARGFFGGNMIGKPSYRMEQIRALFPEAPAAAESFARRLAGETSVSNATGNVVRAAAASGPQKVEQEAARSIPTARGTPGLVALSAARTGLQKLQGMSRDEADELTHLFSAGLTRAGAADNGPIPARLQVLLDNLQHTYGGVVPRATARQAGRRIAGQVGAKVVSASPF